MDDLFKALVQNSSDAIAETRRVKGLGDNQRIKLLEIVEAG